MPISCNSATLTLERWKLKQHFEKPSIRKAREKTESIRRARKLARKKLQREGML